MNIKWLAICFLIGSAVGAWVTQVFNDAATASEFKRTTQFRDELRSIVQEISTESAKVLDTKLQDLHSNEIRTERVVHTETVKPVFTTVCATDEYVRLLNDSIASAERTLSSQPDGNVPGNVTPTDRHNRQ